MTCPAVHQQTNGPTQLQNMHCFSPAMEYECDSSKLGLTERLFLEQYRFQFVLARQEELKPGQSKGLKVVAGLGPHSPTAITTSPPPSSPSGGQGQCTRAMPHDTVRFLGKALPGLQQPSIYCVGLAVGHELRVVGQAGSLASADFLVFS